MQLNAYIYTQKIYIRTYVFIKTEIMCLNQDYITTDHKIPLFIYIKCPMFIE